MNELIDLNAPVSMTSKEIAILLEKRHSNVKRTIETLVNRGTILKPQIEFLDEISNLGQPIRRQVYRFAGEQGKRDSFVVADQLAPEHASRIKERWAQLEAEEQRIRAASPARSTGVSTFDHPTFGSVRVVTLKGQGNDPWFIAKDVADALGFADPANTVRRQCKHRKSLFELKVDDSSTLGLHPQTQLIPESDVYRLIMRSRLPSAEQFQDWVTEEVLPAIRKDGLYVAGEEKVKTGEMSIEEMQLRVFEYLKAKTERLESANQEQAAIIEEHLGQVTTDEWRALNHQYLSHGEKVRLGKTATMVSRRYGVEPIKQYREIPSTNGETRTVGINVYQRSHIDEAARMLGLL